MVNSVISQNQLKVVTTWQESALAFMQNVSWVMNHANMKYNNLNSFKGNRGDTISFDRQPRSIVTDGLIVNMSPSVQLTQTLTVSQAANIGHAYDALQFMYQADTYMDKFGKSCAKTLASRFESDVLLNFISQVRGSNPNGSHYQQIIDPASGPYRFFYPDGPITTSQQLGQAVDNFNDMGFGTDTCGVIPLTSRGPIVQSMLSQFVPKRNDDVGYNWEIGEFNGCDWATSNLLPKFYAGNVGNAGTILTLVGTNDPSGTNVTQLTFSGATPNDQSAVVNGDLFVFQDSVTGQPDLRYNVLVGDTSSDQPVQFRATAASAANGSGNVTINIYPALSSSASAVTSGVITSPLTAGMKIKGVPNHRAGCIMSSNPLYVAAPPLRDDAPYPTNTVTDSETGISLRHYWGAKFGLDEYGYVWDMIWASTLIADNCMRLIFPF